MPEIGKQLAHYEILSKIGQGGMGEVFLAQDTRLERKVAIKFLPQNMMENPHARERFLREARSVATLNHPHICVVHEANETGDVPYIVMEYVDGETLKDRLARSPLPLQESLRLAAEMAEALEEAHSRRIIHRDLKPANVMLTRTGHVKVMDFGLAKRLLSSEEGTTEEETLTELTRTGTTIGTLAYMSPEQLQGQRVDHRSDIFSFGAVLYEMLGRVHPFRKAVGMATAAAILNKEPEPLSGQVPEIPPRLQKLVSEMLAKTPDRRPQSMRAIHEELNAILLEVQPRPVEAGTLNLRKLARSLRRPRIVVPAAAILVLLVLAGSWFFQYRANVRWAREQALPEIEKLIKENVVWRNLAPAYRLAERADAFIPGDSKLAALIEKCSVKINIKTDPPGAKIYMKDYEAPESEWSYMGDSPIERIRLPIGIFRWKMEKEGYETVLAASSSFDVDPANQNAILPSDLQRTLDRAGSITQGMVRVQGADTPSGKLGDFYIDRYEVTNRQFKEFIENGGYGKREFWKQPILKEGKELSWEEARREFVDQTDQPGPSQWQAGDYPDGEADYPVSGISWYEAAAYAEYANKSLPTDIHWSIASGQYTPLARVLQLGGSAALVSLANFSGNGPLKAGSLAGVTPFGAFDMAGNVREWCWNETPYGRLIRGGAWDDNLNSFSRPAQAPPMDRSARNGFRCAAYIEPEKIPEVAFQAVTFAGLHDFSSEKPISDSVFQVYREKFSYDKSNLNEQVDRQESPGGWIREKITFDAAYGGERILAYLFIPGNAQPPYQTVLYFPGDGSAIQRSSRDIENYYEFTTFLSFLVKNGRAVLYPVYKGTFERWDPTLVPIHDGADSYAYSEYLIQLVKDFRRCIDYLETRQDIDSRKLAYYGVSWGANLGAIIPAIEGRLAAGVLIGGSLISNARAEASPISYVRRVKIPTLVLAGKYDINFLPGIQPLFDLLGTAPGDKQLLSYDSDQIPPRNEVIKETLAWLDRYLGQVK